MDDLLGRLVNDLALWCERDSLATVSEGHLKVEAMRSLLAQGAVLLEGSNSARSGWRIAVVSEQIEAALYPLPQHPTKPDLRVIEPIEVCLELKVRPDFGSLAQARSSQFEKDFRNVAEGRADALVIAFGPIGYQAMRGVKANARGRKPTFTLESVLPDPDKMDASAMDVFHGTHVGMQLTVLGHKCSNGRLVTAIRRRT